MLSQTGFTVTRLKTVFLDRDGVINEKMVEGSYVQGISDFRLIPGVAQAIARLNRAGARVIVVSNQRGVALGLYTADAVDAVHRHLESELVRFDARIDAFFYCPHDRNSCNCRKPLPGMYEQAKAQFPDIVPEESIMIGDSLSDVEFGRATGMMTAWIAGPEESRKPGWERAAKLADACFESLPEAVDELLKATHLDISIFPGLGRKTFPVI